MLNLTPFARVLLLAGLIAAEPAASKAEQLNLSQDWLVHKTDAAGADQGGYDDRGWTRIVVPHDASIMDGSDGTPFDANAEAGQDSGYLPGGIVWYRKHLSLSTAQAAQVARLNFEAVYMDAQIWVNGQPVATHRYGYSAFSIDLTGKLRAGDNLIAVRVNHEDPSSRWYAGTGLIRPVSLDLMNCAHIEPDSIAITTPVATPKTGEVSVATTVANCAAGAKSVELVNRVVAANGDVVASAAIRLSAPAKGRMAHKQNLTVPDPALWSPESPNLYTLVQQVRVGGAVVDERRTRFGIRTISVDAVKGLRINGQPVRLRGGNIHHDNYMLGAAGFPNADTRKVALMKAAGYNAIRMAHNPASQATLDAADQLGMLVIDEAFDAWNKNKRPKDYARFFADNWERDITSLVVSGRNHPSVLFWSIGNEIPESGTPLGVETGRKLARVVRSLDPSRPVTQGVNAEPPLDDAQFATGDVAGYNYHANLFAGDHDRFPDRVMFTSESTSKDAFDYWHPVETMPWVIGDFVWTAVDYIGETGIGWMGYSQDWQKLGPYPWHLAYCGEIDAIGRKRPAAYYREVLWKTGIDPISAFVRQPKETQDLPDRGLFPTTPPHLDWSLDDVHPSWTWPDQVGKAVEVDVYSEFPEVELFLNGKSLGRKGVGVASQYKATYSVAYAPGKLVAIGYRDGREAGRWELRTAGDPVRAQLHSDKTQIVANGEDLAYVNLTLLDDDGTPIYARDGDRQVTVHVSGAAALAGIGNGNPMDAASFQSGKRTTFHGQLAFVLRGLNQPGKIQVTVDIDGLPAQYLRLDAVAGNGGTR
ncbi:glycoside hydrolase family 2 TIM barrel-domain containing protein [Asticcacaulis sp. 201]|uniref:glycoside hydrolase family 2 TIM barrel-domain containing protein n=1 Tax=Asticcacaulis sp. 201 TaxID=3028787 RepID=UPI0029166CAD|nr:glycoside hydrolase family 2 TIM barrel-domain containing protein [Asticcacaulis sp. 201]MDV6330979.1 glycoside hydrolase family 2 TIM barrel-domain containing protein [Asticcacaulis sp. 201]